MKGPSAMPSLSWHSWAAASGGSSWRKGCSSTLWVTEPARTPFCSRPSAARSAAPGQSALYNGPGGSSVTLCTASLRLHWREPSPIHFTHPGQMEPDQATGSYDVGSKLSTSARMYRPSQKPGQPWRRHSVPGGGPTIPRSAATP